MATASLRRSSSRFEKAHVSRRDATRARGTRVEPQTSPVPLITEADVAERLSATVTPFSAKQLAKATRKSLEAAKAWKDSKRCPNTANTINLARNYECVWEWLAAECGRGARDAQANSSDAIVRWATEFRTAPGEAGAIARAVLREAASFT